MTEDGAVRAAPSKFLVPAKGTVVRWLYKRPMQLRLAVGSKQGGFDPAHEGHPVAIWNAHLVFGRFLTCRQW